MFTSLFMTRYFFAGWVQNPKNKQLNMAQFIGNTHFDFMAQTKKAVVISLIIMIAGSFMFYSQRNTILGMDFTGGYSLVVDLKEKAGETDYRTLVSNALLDHGATNNDFQIRELSRPNQLRLQFGISMEEKDHPFFGMPETETEGKLAYSYQSNPRLVWVVNTLESSGLQIQQSQLEHLDANWTVMSGQLSDAMRNNALIALGLALASILIYITLRFEFKYALGAVIGLVHDVVITLGILALFHKMGFPVQIDLQVIGAIMTIIGYSLNDTIIVFDRIREEAKLHRKMKFVDIINESINVTLSRTLMTSGTTLLVLITLVLLGGKSIFAFSLVMTIGVLVGTFSSLFIAAPVMLYFHNKEEEKEHGVAKRA
jgi:SecD/SecF fusion protein